MTATTLMQRHARPIRREAATHLFAVGQTVRLRANYMTPKTAEIYRITGTLPAKENSPQYRIRSDDERHERVTTQDRIEPVDDAVSGDDATLMETTFGRTSAT